jgi:hypothetical protein
MLMLINYCEQGATDTSIWLTEEVVGMFLLFPAYMLYELIIFRNLPKRVILCGYSVNIFWVVGSNIFHRGKNIMKIISSTFIK